MPEEDFAVPSIRRQAAAYLAVAAAAKALAEAEEELRTAERGRLRPQDALTVIIDGQAVTSSRESTQMNRDAKFEYTVSRVVG